MENKSTWGGARKGAGAPVRLADADKRKNRAIPFSDKEWAEIGRKASGKDMSKSELVRSAVFSPKAEKTWNVAVGNVSYAITEDMFRDLTDAFDVHNVMDIPVFKKAWCEYENCEELPAIDHMEYYATDFVDWVLVEQKSEYYNLIGLTDENDQIHEEYR